MRYGIRSITMDEIAAQLGISKKTIYQFFTDKDAMVEAVVNDEMKRNEEDAGITVSRQRMRYMKFFLQWMACRKC